MKLYMPESDIYWTNKKWKDKSSDFKPLRPVDGIVNFDYDYIVIAVAEEPIATQIRTELIALGCDDGKIVWQEPIMLADV